MKRTIIVAGFLLASAIPVSAAERKISIDTNDLFALMVSLQGLNGQQTLDRDKKSVTLPYDFSGAATIAMAKDLRIVNDELKDYRAALSAQSTGDKAANEKKGAELAAIKRDVSLEMIPTSSLKLDENDISPAILGGLWPILADQAIEAPKAAGPSVAPDAKK